MPFEEVPRRYDFPAREKSIIEFWKEHDIFRRSIAIRDGAPLYVFYEGPPTANGKPHPGHVLTRAIKDLLPRYKTMCGFQVNRKAGWDTHGLPVEIEVEKELGISGKDEIERYGVEPFVRKCMESVFVYTKEWQDLTDRIGFWVDLDEAYITYTTDYVESVWWALSEIHKRGLLYLGHKVLPWCPRCGTALSSHEVGWGYKTVDDPSIAVRFQVKGEGNVYLLAWTTTPWTLISNVALAVDADSDYAYVKHGGDTLIMASALVETVMAEHAPWEIEKTVKGSDLAGMEYEPLYRHVEPKGKAWVVITAGFVTLDTGTGIVHAAPAFGADDYEAGRANGLEMIQLVAEDGTFKPEVTLWAGRFVKECDGEIMEDLHSRGLLFSRGTMRHDYPFCWRCDSPLIYYARAGWFIRTTDFRDRMLELNESITWLPDHIRTGRFGNFLADNIDWALSRERYWGTPLPVWICGECGAQRVVSSKREVEELAPDAFGPFEEKRSADPSISVHLAVHKPFIDEVELPCGECGGTMRRVPEVIDCWFDSGAMPFAQWGYPHAGADRFKAEFPCDFISEAIDQTRGWFYTLLAISTMLFDREPFRHCIVLGLVCDEKGQKMSKSKGNYLEPSAILDRQGADALRWYFYSSNQPWTSVRFYDQAVTSAHRDFLIKLLNVYSFFTIYANIDGFSPSERLASCPATHEDYARAEGYRPVGERSMLDRWVLAEFDSTVRSVRSALDRYDIHSAARALFELVDGLSNWYLRRSRSRFWRSEEDVDKLDAHWTLYEVLAETSKLLAPFVPFISEEIYRNLAASQWEAAPQSVHLTYYPVQNDVRVDEELTSSMGLAREIVSLGRSARTATKIRTRQPLSRLIVILADSSKASWVTDLADTIIEELNVKRLSFADDPTEYVRHELRPNFRALGPRFGSRMKEVQKQIEALEPESARVRLLNDGGLPVELDGEEEVLVPEELEIRLSALAHYEAAESPHCVVVLETDLDDELIIEGHAREIVHQIQSMRKELDLDYQERIIVSLAGDDGGARVIRDVVQAHGGYIKNETLAGLIEEGAPEEGALSAGLKLGDAEISVGVRRAGG